MSVIYILLTGLETFKGELTFESVLHTTSRGSTWSEDTCATVCPKMTFETSCTDVAIRVVEAGLMATAEERLPEVA
jgi:hypothetical protein